MGRKQFTNTVSITAESSVLNNQAISKKITVTTTPIELMVNAEALSGRKAIYLETDANNVESIYIGVGDITITDTNAMMKLAPASARQLDVEGDSYIKVQAKSVSGTNYLRITEMK